MDCDNCKNKIDKKNMIKELGNFKSYKEVLDFVPRSVWELNGRTKEIKELFVDDLEKHICKRTKDGYAVKIKQKFSVFNPILGINILKIWSNIGDKVIDPFAGRDRAIIANYMDRHYLGYEISPLTYNSNNKKIQNWTNINKKYKCEIKLGDGTNIKEKEKFDFCYSCPPYWFREKYESIKGQISDIRTREEWIESINRTAVNLKKILKQGAFAVFIIADIRHKGSIIPLHTDWIREFEKVGFLIKDIIINKTNPMTASGINGYLKNRIMQKTHEYILVFKN